jgi:hypothetical protein
VVTPKRAGTQAPATGKLSDGCGVAAILGIIVVVILAVGRCGSSTDNASYPTVNELNANMSNAIAAQSPPPPEPLNAASIARGTGHLRLAVTAEGLSGAMIYSQNCYDALAREFTWAKLDACGAFDLLAVRSITDADTGGLANEADYFQSEAAAGRYLAAATGAGEPAPEADQRLSQLQARTARMRTVGRAPPAAPDSTEATSSNVTEDTNDSLDADRLDPELAAL